MAAISRISATGLVSQLEDGRVDIQALQRRQPTPGKAGSHGAVAVNHVRICKNRAHVQRARESQSLGHLPSVALRMKEEKSRPLTVTCSGQSLSGRFEELRAKREVALIPFIVAGDPDLETTKKALLALDANGADIIELGVPYSDPLADGPVIQAAASRALLNKTDLSAVLNMLAEVSPKLSAPVVLFTYFNPIMKRGGEQFMKDAKAAGAAGLVVPDVPLEETPFLRSLAAPHDLELVLLVTPTTPQDRMKSIADASEGFVYLVSLTGVTGARVSVQARVEGLIQQMKEATTKPVAVGFGISTTEHATQVADWGADGVIVGSQIVRLLAESGSPEQGLEAMAKFTREVKGALVKETKKELSSV